MLTIIGSIVLFAILGEIQAQVPSLVPCPTDITAMQNFDGVKNLGKWYEHSRMWSAFEIGSKCNTVTYSQDNGTIKIVNAHINNSTGNVESLQGTATLIGNAGEGKYLVKIPAVKLESPIWVLDSDYGNYSVLWSCVNVGTGSARMGWILTRVPVAPTRILDSAAAVLDKFKINKSNFFDTDQINCPKSVL